LTKSTKYAAVVIAERGEGRREKKADSYLLTPIS
jgi:hypothetical protein